MTFKLVAAASTVSGLPVEVCLEEFGKHFLVYCQKNGYDQILRVLGSNLYDFLTNLDNLHDHLASIYPGMRAPSFRVTRYLNTNQQDEIKNKNRVKFNEASTETAPAFLTGDELHKQNASCSLAGSMYLHYYSDRAGLSPIVKGIVMAVAREFFQTDIQVTEVPTAALAAQAGADVNEPPDSGHSDDHVVLKIDKRESSIAGAATGSAKTAAELASEAADKVAPAGDKFAHDSEELKQATSKGRRLGNEKSMLNIYDTLSTNAQDSLVNSEIMMQTFPFHVIFDRKFNLVQVGKSLLRVTSLYWQRQALNGSEKLVKFSDLFQIMRPKIEFTFDAIADHTNQVFVVRTRPLVLNADYRLHKRASSGSSSSSEASGTQRRLTELPTAANQLHRPACPMDRIAAQARLRQRRSSSTEAVQPSATPPSGQMRSEPAERHSSSSQLIDEEPGDIIHNSLSLRLKGQMIILFAGELCLFLCSPRVDHLDQLMDCGVKMSDFSLHDRARELMLMSHTHKEDREAVKKLDQASNDLKKMDTKLRQENKRTNEVLHNIFPAKIASLLSHGIQVESESFDLVSCLYSDIIGFTKMCGSENVKPIDIVRLLNTLYLQFDNLTTIHGVFKVETIGDAYVVVGGLPEPVEDHADRCVKMGLDMVKVIATVRSPADNQPIQMRIGIHSGPVMAGIVGIRVPRYSLFGNTTTQANQLETHGIGGKIHISDFTLRNLVNRERFVIEDNPNEISNIPFLTYFVTNYLSDEIETLKHEKILEEQLIKDFELMGNELELVDESIHYQQQLFDSMRSPTSIGADQDNMINTTTSSTSLVQLDQQMNSKPTNIVEELAAGLRPKPRPLAESLANLPSEEDFNRLILMDIEEEHSEVGLLRQISSKISSAIISDAIKQVCPLKQEPRPLAVLKISQLQRGGPLEVALLAANELRGRSVDVIRFSVPEEALRLKAGSINGQSSGLEEEAKGAWAGNSQAEPETTKELQTTRLLRWLQLKLAEPQLERAAPKETIEERRPRAGELKGIKRDSNLSAVNKEQFLCSKCRADELDPIKRLHEHRRRSSIERLLVEIREERIRLEALRFNCTEQAAAVAAVEPQSSPVGVKSDELGVVGAINSNNSNHQQQPQQQQQQQHRVIGSGQVLSTKMQRIKRMDTLKRRKMKKPLDEYVEGANYLSNEVPSCDSSEPSPLPSSSAIIRNRPGSTSSSKAVIEEENSSAESEADSSSFKWPRVCDKQVSPAQARQQQLPDISSKALGEKMNGEGENGNGKVQERLSQGEAGRRQVDSSAQTQRRSYQGIRASLANIINDVSNQVVGNRRLNLNSLSNIFSSSPFSSPIKRPSSTTTADSKCASNMSPSCSPKGHQCEHFTLKQNRSQSSSSGGKPSRPSNSGGGSRSSNCSCLRSSQSGQSFNSEPATIAAASEAKAEAARVK